MKVESLVIADQHAAVNKLTGLVHTARQILGIGQTLNARTPCIISSAGSFAARPAFGGHGSPRGLLALQMV
jgi:hypothetical protein